MERRTFLKLSGAGALGLSLEELAAGARPGRPNVLIVMTDQQFADAMSCVIGTRYLRTPAMDALVHGGMQFTRAYSPNPLCMPMRASFITGHYPHQTGVQNNSPQHSLEDRGLPFLGKTFRDAGYETAYFGKWHVALSKKRADTHGFDTFEEKAATLDPEPAAAFLRRPHDRPFLAVASFLSPHEICQWSRFQDLPGGDIATPPAVAERPPVPANHAAPRHETDIMAHMRRSYQAHPLFPVGDYTEADWRRHVWGYYRLIERADGFLGAVMAALRAGGHADHTIVLFLSDHGDCHGAHRWNQKTVFYDESARVPYVLSWPGRIPRGQAPTLVNTGIDTFPTLCELAGIPAPAGLPGRSLARVARGEDDPSTPDFVVSENHMVQCRPVDGVLLQPEGRMVRSRRYKYCLYSEGERRESLVDMDADPGEMANLAGDAAHAAALRQHRDYLRRHAEATGDATARAMLDHVTRPS